MLRISHEVRILETVPTREDLNGMNPVMVGEYLQKEIRNRERIIEGLKHEIRELEELR